MESGIAVAVDDESYRGALLQPIAGDSEVILITKIAGGQGLFRGSGELY